MSLTSNDLLKLRIGSGFDVHAFAAHRKLILGGTEIEYDLGLMGHSDADVLIHSIIDSLLSPSGLPDIGVLFPDTDPQFKGISSMILLERVYSKIREKNIRIINIDSTIICERPKISRFIPMMKSKLSTAFLGDLDEDAIGIKATTTEKLGFTGRGEGIAVTTSSLILLP